jgi:AraC-like DNA-binding protein
MRPQHLKIHLQPEQSFSIRHDVVPYFYNELHYHSEIELVYIIKGSGRQFVGGSVNYFKRGDMILVGENLPHLWRCDEKYLAKTGELNCEAYVVHFTSDCLGKDFFHLPENKNILALIKKAKHGIRIKDHTKSEVIKSMQEMLTAPPAKRVILLIQILEIIAASKPKKPICRQLQTFDFSPSDSEKMNNIYQYIMEHFSRDLSLKEVAGVACLSPNSFCRYFKSRIKKSFSKFLIEVRIGHACTLLAETEISVAEICYQCGYNNFSNFNRHFKTITLRTPIQHRKYYHEARRNEVIDIH